MTDTDKTQAYLSDGASNWSDLEEAHGNVNDPELAARIKRMSRNYRKAPDTDQQLDFFVPTISDVSNKDDCSLMDIAVFGLGRKPRFEPIKHDLPDAIVTIQGGSISGMATIFDYDIFLYMASYLTREMDRVKDQVRQGIDAPLPPRQFRPPVSELLKFCRRDDGGENYTQLEKALERLSTTNISIREKRDDKKTSRRVGLFSLLGGYKAKKETKTGKISELSIDIPNWVYDGIVRPEKPTVLTLHNDYFLLAKGYHRFLHRMARKAAGANKATYSLETLYERSGSTSPFRSFKADLKKAVAELKDNPLPDYSVKWEVKGKSVNVIFIYTGACE